MEIAKGISHTDWHKLELTNPISNDWERAIDIFSKRLTERYLEPADRLVEIEKDLQPTQKKYGFTVLAIDCMLIETLQSFYEGETDTNGKSKKMFVNFLTGRDSFKTYFTTTDLAERFYYNYRCGILHQSETQVGAKVWAVGELLMQHGTDLTVNRVAFHEGLKKEFEKYIETLKNPSNSNERANFEKKMNFISRKQISLQLPLPCQPPADAAV